MKNIAMISLTHSAVIPMAEQFRQVSRLYSVTNYLDEGLQRLIERQGSVTRDALTRMINLLYNAVRDGADGILLSCTVFTPFAGLLEQIMSVPVFSADAAMLEEAAVSGKSTAILCTFPVTVQSSSDLYKVMAEKHGSQAKMQTYLLDDAAQEQKNGSKAGHDQIIAEKALELAGQYEQIVLAQVSMSDAARLIPGGRVPVLTSPRSALRVIENYFQKRP